MKRVLFLLTMICGFFQQSDAQGNLLITPIRVVFEGTKQNEEFNLVNTGIDTATFSISFLQFIMKEDGTMIKSDKSESLQMSAAPYLRMYPSRITLAPGEPQVIRLQYKRKPNMLPGEYRSHLYFRAEKDNPSHGPTNPNSVTTQLTIQLTAVYGLCLPIIIRTNDAKVSSTLSDLELVSPQASSQFLKFTINRSGNISTYGDIIVEYLPLKGKSIQLAIVKGVGVYTDISKRNMAVKLNTIPGNPLSKGRMKVSYITSDASGKPFIYTKSELEI